MRVLAAREEWMTEAECRGVDPAMFFPVRGQSAEPAKRICADCPVAQECVDYALRHTWLTGIFGGMSARERRAVKAGRS